jgi:hypothetical protein
VGRHQRLSRMGFDASHEFPSFGRYQWIRTIFAIILIGIALTVFTPGTRPTGAGKVLIISITFGVSIGFAVLGAIVVAKRFIERRKRESLLLPPLAELTIAALIVVGLSVGARIAIPLVPALMLSGSSGLQDVVTQFVEGWPGTITPVVCTISLGILCSYLGSLNWSWYRVAAVGALGNGLAFMAAAGSSDGCSTTRSWLSSTHVRGKPLD